jgi:hypothetical protein
MGTTLILSTPSQRAVLEVLVDMSAAGMLAPFAWIEGREHENRDVPEVLWVENGDVSVRRLTELANGIEDRARLLSMVPYGEETGDPISVDAEYRYRERFRPRVGVPTTYVRLLVPWERASSPRAFAGMPTWHNVVVSPESSETPDVRPSDWWHEPETTVGSVAAAVVHLGGLMAADPVSVLDSREPHPSAFQVARFFLSAVDASDVETDLRDQVLRFDGRLEQVRTEAGVDVGPVPDPAAGAAAMADQWWNAVRDDLVTPLPEVPVFGRTTLSLGETLRWFFTFLWQSIKGLPRGWLANRVRDAKAGAAGVVSRVVFGERDVAYRVVVGGIADDGRPASWHELRTAAVSLKEATSDPAAPQRARPPLGNASRTLVDGALTLLDAKSRRLNAIRSTTGEGIVDVVARVAPAPHDRWSEAARSTNVSPTDLMALDERELDLSERAASDITSAQTLDRLRAWRRSTSENYLVRSVSHVTREIRLRRELVAQLTELLASGTDDNATDDSRRTGTLLRVLAALVAVALVVVGVLYATEQIDGGEAAIYAGVAVLLWLVLSFVAFVRRQQRFFQALAAAREVEEVVPHIQASIQQCASDIEVLLDAYETLQPWCSVLTEFVHAPFGRVRTGVESAVVPAGLPRSIRMAKAAADPERLERVANTMRMRYFTVGWAGSAWERVMDSIPEALPDDMARRRIERDPELMHDQDGGDGSVLEQWRAAVTSDGVGERAAAELWAPSRYRLDEDELGMVTSAGRPVRDFLSSLHEGAAGEVSKSVLTVHAMAVNKEQTVENVLRTQGEDGLSELRSLIQLTGYLAEGDLEVPSRTLESARVSPGSESKPAMDRHSSETHTSPLDDM